MAQQPSGDSSDKKSKIPAHAVIGPHTPDKNGASNYYTYYLTNAAGKRLKGDGYATEEHIKSIDTIGNVNIPFKTSEGTFVPSANGEITDRVGLSAPLPAQYTYFNLSTQTFTISFKGQNYDLSTEFIHITAASGGKVTTAAVGVVVP